MKKRIKLGDLQNYDDDFEVNWSCYYEQIKLLKTLKIKNILELGCGRKVVTNYLRNLGYNLTTLDFDKNLQPDILGNVSNCISLLNGRKFDIIIASHIFYYIPYDNAISVIQELSKHCRYIYIGLLHQSLSFQFTFKIPLFEIKRFNINLPLFKLKTPNYEWELGNNISYKKFRSSLLDNYEIIIDKRSKIYPRNHIFLLRSKLSNLDSL